jgi:RNA polymerase sigma factor (sigma-70 family)
VTGKSGRKRSELRGESAENRALCGILRDIADSHGRTLRDLAGPMKCSRTVISERLNGESRPPWVFVLRFLDACVGSDRRAMEVLEGKVRPLWEGAAPRRARQNFPSAPTASSQQPTDQATWMATMRDMAAAQRVIAELQLSSSRNLAIAQGLYGMLGKLSAAALALSSERDALRRELSVRPDPVARLLQMTVLLEATQQRLDASEQRFVLASQKLDEATRQYVEAERLKGQASLQVASARHCLASIEQRAAAFAEQVRAISQTGGDNAVLIGGFAQSFAKEVLARVDWALNSDVAQLSTAQHDSTALDGQKSHLAKIEERNKATVESSAQNRATENHDDRDETVKPFAEAEAIPRPVFAKTSMQSQEVFFSHWWPRLLRFLISQASNPSVAEDVASDTFMYALERWDLVVTLERPDSWLFKVAVRRLRRQEALACTQSSLTDNLARTEGDLRTVPSPNEWVADHLDLIAALRRLPRRQSEVVALRWLQEFTMEETAECLGISVDTVRRELSRARKELVLLLQSDAVGPVIVQANVEPSDTVRVQLAVSA